jgi:hypothetical protein
VDSLHEPMPKESSKRQGRKLWLGSAAWALLTKAENGKKPTLSPDVAPLPGEPSWHLVLMEGVDTYSNMDSHSCSLGLCQLHHLCYCPYPFVDHLSSSDIHQQQWFICAEPGSLRDHPNVEPTYDDKNSHVTKTKPFYHDRVRRPGLQAASMALRDVYSHSTLHCCLSTTTITTWQTQIEKPTEAKATMPEICCMYCHTVPLFYTQCKHPLRCRWHIVTQG